MSLSKKILIGLFTGVLTGLFFGEHCFFFSYIGDGFIGLLQMTVLPYIIVNIVANLGRMSMSDGKKMVFNGLKVLLLLLGIGVIALIILPLGLPQWTASSFFKPSVVAVEPQMDFLKTYIPSNPFESMANSVVPAIVIFSIFLGIGLSRLKDKEVILKSLDVFGDGLNQINKMVVQMTPYGVFAIAAYNAGNMTMDEIQRLHAYIIIYTVAVLVFGFYWIPLLISSLTDVSPKALFKATKPTLLTIFATSKIIIVLPQLIEDIKTVLLPKYSKNEEMAAKTEIMMPLSYPFPNLGTFVIFVFVPFIGWYMGNSFSIEENFVYVGSTLLSSFVAPVTGIPFILDLLKLPQEMFQLFVISSVYTDRIRVVFGTIHLLALTIITVVWTVHGLKPKWKKLIRGSIIGVILTVLSLLGTRIYLSYTLGESKQYTSFVEMDFTNDYKAAKVKTVESLYTDSLVYYASNQLESIIKRGTIRIGYLPDHLPFAFRNQNGKLVGFDVEMAHLLAKELKVKAEFYRINKSQMQSLLEEDRIDIVMSGIIVTTDVLSHYAFSKSYIDQTLAFMVPDHMRTQFSSRTTIKGLDSLRIGSAHPYFANKLKHYLPKADIISLNSPREYFKDKHLTLDALLLSAEAGSAWTVIYPQFHVSIPRPDVIKVPCAYPLPMNDESWKLFIDTWIELKQKEGTTDALFKYWIEGEGADIKEPRWCIARDVLQWIE
ncbi:cation:dicarboxylate symporter family transporter [Carboxylicivirga sp. N1Y90]|uniref:cation:dicarboxylate symporter family transporter n=1 Tax=Carboxylicivirga fragile TaxID=3417571 RepID=UPI003D352CE9|nr:cation:dicarboxylase symporter family transporter [Marinilabiliaceae bacterium N1Y90]